MNKFFEEVGQTALATANAGVDTLLLYAELKDGVISADIFFKPINSTSVQFRFAPQAIKEKIYEFWSSDQLNLPAQSWMAMEFVVRDGKFDAAFKYEADFLPGEDLHDRRPRVVAGIFPDIPIDYSRSR